MSSGFAGACSSCWGHLTGCSHMVRQEFDESDYTQDSLQRNEDQRLL